MGAFKLNPAVISTKWHQASPIVFVILLGLMLGLGCAWIFHAFSGRVALFVPLVLVAGIALLIFMRHIKLFVFFLVLYAPFELFVQKWLPGDIGLATRYMTEVFLLLIFMALVFDRLLYHKPWRRTPLDIPLLIFIGVGILSALVNQVSPLVALMGLRILLRYVLLFYLVVQIGFDHASVRRLLVAMFCVALVVAGIGLIQALIGPAMTEILRVPDIVIGEHTVRSVTGFFTAHGRYIFSTLGRYDALGMYNVIILLFSLALYIHYPRRRGIIGWLIVITGICLALSFSRQSWLALYAALWAWLFVLYKKKWAISLSAVLLVAPMILGMIVYLSPEIVRFYKGDEGVHISALARLVEVFSPEYRKISAYYAGRLFVLRFVGARILELAPFLGFGPGTFGTQSAAFFGFSNANLLGMQERQVFLVNDVNWITILGQYGLIGTAAFLMIFAVLFRYAWRMYKRLSDPLTKSVALACQGSIVALLLLGFFGPNFEQRVIALYVWLIAGLTVTLAHTEQRIASRGK